MLTACCLQSSAQAPRPWAAGLSELRRLSPGPGQAEMEQVGRQWPRHQAGSLKSTLKGYLFKSQKRWNAMITGLCQFVLESKLDQGSYSEKPRF